MIINVDLDGVLYDYHGAYCYMANEYFRPKEWLYVADWDAWNYPAQVLSFPQLDWMDAEAVDLGLYRYGHVIKGGIVGIRKLEAMGHQLQVVTHRPRHAVQDTLDWLSYVRLPFSGIHILSDEQPKTDVPGDLLIDDKLSNCEDYWEAGRYAFLFKRPWNEASPTQDVVKSWPDAVDQIARMEEL